MHSIFGGSKAKQWMTCPGSIVLSAYVNAIVTPESSKYAWEGTQAHAVAERLLLGWEPTGELPVDKAMLEHGRAYREGILNMHAVYGITNRWWVEYKAVDIQYPEVYGYVDYVGLNDARDLLVITDYKYGAGIPVSPVENYQLRYYAALALEGLAPGFNGDVVLAIYQPRCEDGGWKYWQTTASAIREFHLEIRDAVFDIKNGNPELVAGEHCRWCVAKPVCPAFTKYYFPVSIAEGDLPTHLSAEDVSFMLKREPIAKKWFDEAKAFAKAQIQLFGDFEGFTVQKKKGQSDWTNPINVEATYPADQYPQLYTTKLKTPKQAIEMLPALKKEEGFLWNQKTYESLVSNVEDE